VGSRRAGDGRHITGITGRTGTTGREYRDYPTRPDRQNITKRTGRGGERGGEGCGKRKFCGNPARLAPWEGERAFGGWERSHEEASRGNAKDDRHLRKGTNLIENGEIFVKMAKIEDGILMTPGGNEYYLHTADCDAINRGETCDCNGADVLDEILATLAAKGATE
jgi:hypothetical protein